MRRMDRSVYKQQPVIRFALSGTQPDWHMTQGWLQHMQSLHLRQHSTRSGSTCVVTRKGNASENAVSDWPCEYQPLADVRLWGSSSSPSEPGCPTGKGCELQGEVGQHSNECPQDTVSQQGLAGAQKQFGGSSCMALPCCMHCYSTVPCLPGAT